MEKWIKSLPRSRVMYPQTLGDQLKYWFWKAYTPLHPLVREASYHLGFGKLLMSYVVPEMSPKGRQDFLLGTIDPKYSVHELVAFLISNGFGKHFIAWRDTDEVVSLRRTINFKYQYHIRIFKDGEVRGHYEYTPECHPVHHLIRVGFEDRTQEFKSLLKDWIL